MRGPRRTSWFTRASLTVTGGHRCRVKIDYRLTVRILATKDGAKGPVASRIRGNSVRTITGITCNLHASDAVTYTGKAS